MPFPALGINVMIASPGDVENERQAARDLIHEWNDTNAQDQRIVLLPMGWESHSSPRMGDRPQAIINKQLLSKCDLLVAIFWTRLGTATGEAASGTVEEITKHVAAGKIAMVYFSTAPVALANVEQEQYQALLQFRGQCQQQGLFHQFASLAQFRDDFRRHLALTIQRGFPQNDFMAEFRLITTANQRDTLSEDARQFLSEASKDPNGYILWIESMDGFDLQTNNTAFVETGSSRSAARWRAVVQELERMDLVERLSESVLRVTDAGFHFFEQ